MRPDYYLWQRYKQTFFDQPLHRQALSTSLFYLFQLQMIFCFQKHFFRFNFLFYRFYR